MYKNLVAFLLRFRVIGLVVMAILTGFFITQIAKMEIFTRFIDLFPQNHRYVQVHQQYERCLGSAYMATLVLEVSKGDVYNTETLKKMKEIYLDVDLIPGVNHFGIFALPSPRVHYTRETAQGVRSEQLLKVVPETHEKIKS